MEDVRKIPVLLGDGNAFAILAACSRAMKRAGVYEEEWTDFHTKATSGDYNNLLMVVSDKFDVTLESELHADAGFGDF